MAGINRDHMLAAIITPAAKPNIRRWKAALLFPPRKKTTAAPKAVIRKVKPVPAAAHNNACVKIKILSRRGKVPHADVIRAEPFSKWLQYTLCGDGKKGESNTRFRCPKTALL